MCRSDTNEYQHLKNAWKIYKIIFKIICQQNWYQSVRSHRHMSLKHTSDFPALLSPNLSTVALCEF